MVCIYCDGKTDVINSRPQKRLNRVWRRRHCQACRAIFTTIEAGALNESLMVRPKTPKQALQPFLRDKLYLSVVASCRHRKNAVTDATALTDTVIGKLTKATDSGVVYRDQLRTIVKEALQRFDQVAAVHYSAFHKD
jgi:transcriptional repressor NrdR